MRRYGVVRDLQAGCHECAHGKTQWSGKNAQAVAARHHDATGHHTWVDVYMSISYGRGKEKREREALEKLSTAAKEAD